MSLMLKATVWSKSGEKEYKIDADTACNVINLTQEDQEISIMDKEHAKSLLLAIETMAHALGWEL